MTRERELVLRRALLRALHDRRGGQLTAVQLHGAMNAGLRLDSEPGASLAESEEIRNQCDVSQWIRGVYSNALGVMRWNITDLGEAALLEML